MDGHYPKQTNNQFFKPKILKFSKTLQPSKPKQKKHCYEGCKPFSIIIINTDLSLIWKVMILFFLDKTTNNEYFQQTNKPKKWMPACFPFIHQKNIHFFNMFSFLGHHYHHTISTTIIITTATQWWWWWIHHQVECVLNFNE